MDELIKDLEGINIEDLSLEMGVVVIRQDIALTEGGGGDVGVS